MLSWSGVFLFGTFMNIALSESRCIFAFGPSSSLLTLFPCYLSIRLFYYALFVPIFCSEIVLFLCYPVVGMSSCILPLHASRIFSLFWNVLFCLYCFIVSRYFSSFASTFWFISWSCIILLVMLLFSFRPNIFQRSLFVLSFSLVVDFLFAFPVEFPIQVLSFCLSFLRELQFYNRLISPLHRLIR